MFHIININSKVLFYFKIKLNLIKNIIIKIYQIIILIK